MNHLKLRGRAGIIVPEGIIFQSANSYKKLRKNLVEDGLWAVISLPSGVFNPYSGVKTSILLFDNEIAKKFKFILFAKVNNDGYSLGAQRKEIDDNDLDQIQNTLKSFREYILKGKKDSNFYINYFDKKNKKLDEKVHSIFIENYTFVKKEKLAEKDEYNLTGDRYREVLNYSNVKWKMVELGEVCNFIGGYAFKSDELKKVKISYKYLPVIKIGNIDKSGILDISNAQYFEYNESLKKYLIELDDILIAMTGATVGKVAYSQHEDMLLNQRVGLVRADQKQIIKSFLKNLLLSKQFYNYCQIQAGGGAQGNISPNQIKSYKIPLPPLEVQEQIVAEVEQYQKVIDGAKQVVENWKPCFRIDSSWEVVELGEVCDILDNLRKPITKSDRKIGKYPYYGATGILDYVNDYIFEEKLVLIGEDGAKWRKGDKTAFIANGKYWVNNHAHVLRPDRSKLLDELLVELINLMDLSKYITGITVPKLNQGALKSIKISLPPLETQKQIIADIQSEQKTVNGNKELIKKMEKKIEVKIDEVWGEKI
jgi:type I restriction enzyme M protein